MDTKINKKFSKNVDYKKTSKTYNKKEKKRGPTLDKEKIVDLNASGSVKAKLNFGAYLNSPNLDPNIPPSLSYILNKVSFFIDKPTHDPIDRAYWLELVKKCGGKVDGGHIEWPKKQIVPGTVNEYVDVTMRVEDGIRLPKNSNELFRNCCFEFDQLYNFETDDVVEMKEMFKFTYWAFYPHQIRGIGNWDVSKVVDFSRMFEAANVGELNLSNWKLHPWLSSHPDKTENTFNGCRNLDAIALPKGFKTTISSTSDNNVKIVKLEKGFPARVKSESHNLKNPYKIDDNGTAIYHIYNKDKYVGVTFDKNGGDSEAWVNHAFVEKSKGFVEGGGSFPVESPKRAGHTFLGWAKSPNATIPDFKVGTTVNGDMKVYAVWKKLQEVVSIKFDKNGGEGDMPTKLVTKGSSYELPPCAFTAPLAEVFDKWEVTVGTAAPVYKQPGETIVASDHITVKAIWRLMGLSLTINFDKNGGEGDMPFVLVKVGSIYELPSCAFKPPLGKVFDKWEVTVGTGAPIYKQPGETIVVYNHTTVKAIWKNNVNEVPLNASGNVYAKLDSAKNVNISAKNTSGDMKIEYFKWRAMKKEFGGEEMAYGPSWEGADVKDINFQTEGIYLPSNCQYLFDNFLGQINGCEKLKADNVTYMYCTFLGAKNANPNVSTWNTSNVDTMSWAFRGASNANPDVSNWNVSNVTGMSGIFGNSGITKADLSNWKLHQAALNNFDPTKEMFKGCSKLEYLKTPVGLKTTISEANSNFKIVKLKKGSPVSVENESQNLNTEYTINSSGDKDAMYHIYRKDKYAGVTFDKNGGDSDAWINHEIAEKGKGFGRTGKLPAERPVRAGYKFRGWATSPSATVSDFDFTFPVNDDMKLYAIWRNNTEEIPLNDSGNVYAKLDSAKNVNVSAVSTLGNMHIDDRMWCAMITELGGKESALGTIWKDADVNDINFQTEGIYLPAFSENFFAYFPGHINGCEKLKTDNVTRMAGIFSNTNKANPNVSNWNTSKVNLMINAFAKAKAANPDVSKWDVSNVTHMGNLFFKSGIVKADLSKWNLNTEITNGPLLKCENMLKGCNNLEYLKTPTGLKTSVSEANSNFKIVKLKKGTPASVEKESQNLNAEYTINESGDKDAMYHIYRKDKHAGITFDKNGGDSEGWVNHEIVEKGKSIKQSGGVLPAEAPQKNLYRFKGWDKSIAVSGSGSFTENTTVSVDTKVYAVWKTNTKITISFDANGGNLGSIPASKEVYEGEALLDDFPAYDPANVANMDPKREGYTFIGWGYDINSEAPEATRDTIFTKPVTLYAIWKEGSSETITVDFDANGGAFDGEAPSVTFEKGTALGARFPQEVPKKDGKAFLGFAKSKEAGLPDVTPDTVFDEGGKVYAVWKDAGTVYKVEFDVMGGKPDIAPVYVESGKSLGERFPKKLPRKAGKDFIGFTSSKTEAESGNVTNANKIDKNTNITKNTVAYAAFKDKTTSSVHFNANGGELGSVPPKVDTAYNTSLGDKFPTGTPTKTGHTFKGWTKSKEEADKGIVTDANKVDKDTVITDDVTAYAAWSKKEYDVHFMSEDEEVQNPFTSPIKCLYGESLGDKFPTQAPESAQSDNYVFKGYSTNKDEAEDGILKPEHKFDKDTKVTGEITVYAVWRELVTVSFNANGGLEASLPQPKRVEKDEKLGSNYPTEIPTYEGNTFLGWSTDPNAQAPDITADSVITKNTTLYAVWEPIKYEVTFMNGMKKHAVKYAVHNTALGVDMPDEPEKSGYVFMGWSKKANDPTLSEEFTKDTIVIAKTKVYAQFKDASQNQITKITLSLSTSKLYEGDTAEAIAEIEPSDAPDKSLKWSSSNGSGLEVKDIGNCKASVEAKRKGTYTITAKAKDGSGVEGKLTVEVLEKQPEPPASDVNVTFNAGSAAGFPKVVSVAKGKALLDKMPKAPKIHGLKFLGWSTKILGGKDDIDFAEDTTVKNDMDVYAVYEEDSNVNVEPKIEKITLESQKNEISVGEEIDVTAKIEPANAALKDLKYYVSAGLTAVKIDGNKLRIRGKATGNQKVKAFAMDGSHKEAELEIKVVEKTPGKKYVWLMAEGIMGYPQLIEVEEGKTMGALLPMGLVKPGMEFRGWSTKGYGGEPDFTSADIVDRDLTLYAVFKPSVPVPPEKMVQSIDLKLSKSTVYDGDEVDILAEVKPADAADKTLEWSIAPKNAKLSIVNEKCARAENLREGKYTVTAKSTDGSNIVKKIVIDVLKEGSPASDKATVRFVAAGAAGFPEAVEVKKGETIGAGMPADPELTGFIFKGWSTKMNPAGVSDVNFTKDTVVNDDMSVYAVFEKDPNAQVDKKIEKIELKASKSEIEAGTGLDILAKITPPDADMKHLTFESSDADKFPVEQVTDVTARVFGKKVGTYKITAKANDGSDKQGEITIKVVPKKPITKKHTLTMMSDLAGYPKTVMVEDGKAAGDKLDTNLTKPGAEFKGWSTESAAGPVNFTKDTLVYIDTIVYAVFEYKNIKPIESIDIMLSKKSIQVGDYVDAICTVDPVDASNKDIKFEVSPSLNIKKTSLTTARIYAAREGTYTLTAKATDGSNVFKQIVFKVVDNGTSPIPSTHAKVVFNADGDNSFPKVLTVKKGKSLGSNMPKDPARDGFTFKEWRIVGSGDVFTKDTVVNEDTEVYAKYEKNGVITKKITKITLLAGNTLLKPGEQTTVAAFIEPEDADYKDLTFTSLNPSVLKIEKTGEITARATGKMKGSALVRAEANDGSGVSSDIMINVEPKKEYVKLTMEAEGIPNFPKEVDVVKGENYADLPMNLKKAGHVFMGWSTTSSTGSVDFNKHTKVMTDSKIYAVFKKDIVNVTVRADGVAGYPMTIPVQRGNVLGNLLPKTIEKEGYTFKGYSTVSPFGAIDFTENTQVTDDLVVYAVFEASQPPVKKVEKITLAVTKSNIKKGDTFDVIADIEPSDATNKVLEFTSSDSDKLKITSIKDQRITLSALQAGNYSVTAKATDGSGIETSIDIEVKENTSPVPSKVKATIHAEGVEGYPQVIEINKGDTLGDKLPEKIEKAGYDFLGYSKENNGPINFFSDTVVKEDMNVYAVHKKQGPIVKPVEKIQLTAGSIKMQLGDITDVIAVVTPPDATDKRVRFTLDRPEILKILSADDASARVEAIGEGTVKVKAEALDGSGVSAELTMEVIRKPGKKVKVTLNAVGVVGYPKVVETEKGTSLDANLPTDLKKAGHVFMGWSDEENGPVNFTKHTQVSRDTDIYAVFKKDEVSALFIAEKASGFPKLVMVDRDKAIGDKMPIDPVRAGYDFEGWSTDSSLGPVNVTKDTVLSNDTVIYAVFKKQGAITKPVSEITLGVTKSNIEEGDEAAVIASVLPYDADDKSLEWTSSDNNKLKIERTGENFARINAIQKGTYTIKAKAKDGSNVEASIKIKVLGKGAGPVSDKVSVMISADGAAGYPRVIEIDKGTTLKGKLPANIEKTGCEFKGFTKTMGNPADFNENEVINEDLTLYAVFEQVSAPSVMVKKIELNKSKNDVRVGDAVDIIPTITPGNADNKSLNYMIDKKDLALIHKNPDGTLRLYAKSKGTVVVTAKATDGSGVAGSIDIEIGEEEQDKVNITLNAEGVAGYPKQLTVNKGEALGNALPNELYKEDYDFIGWSTTPGGMIDVNRLTPMTSSINIYAVFVKKQVSVKMLAEGVAGYPKSVTLDIHSTLGAELPTNLVKAGYEFRGWSKDSFTGDINVTAVTKIDESMTIYAVFKRIAPIIQKVESIKIEDLNSGKKVVDKEFNLLANILPLNADDKTLKWTTSDPAVRIVQKQNNLVSVVASKAGNFSITAKAMDGSGVEDTFVFTVEEVQPDIKNVTLEATDTLGYPRVLKVNKGENLVGKLPMNLEREGYTFVGWSNVQGSPVADFDQTLPVTEDITLYAVFKKNIAPIKLVEKIDLSGKTDLKIGENTYITAAITPADADNKELKFESTDPEKLTVKRSGANEALIVANKKGTAYVKATAMDGSGVTSELKITITAEMKTITFSSGEGTGDMPMQQVEQGSEFKLPQNGFTAPAEKEFDAWEVKGTGTPARYMPGDTITVHENLVVTAKWKDINVNPETKVTAKFEKGDPDASGSMSDVTDIVKGSDYTLPENGFTAPTGLKFDKWKVEVGSTPAVFKMPGDTVKATDNMVVTAVWKNAESAVTFYETFDETKVLKQITVAQGMKIGDKLPEDPVRDGFTFKHWTTSKDDPENPANKVTKDTVINADTKVYAVWDGDEKHKVVLDGNGGVLAGGFEATLNVEEGSTIKAQLEAAVTNNMFTKPGYKLIGFSKSKFALAADYNVDAPVYTNFTLYAVYEEAPELTTVTIKYSDIDLGEDAKIEGVRVGKPIGAKLDGNARDRDGYRFLGYSKVQNAEKPDFFKKSIVTENLVIYPVYKEATNEDKVKVAFKLNDGTDASLKTEEVTRYESLGNKMPTKDKVAERDGYLFTGWAKSKSAKYPDFFRSTVVKGDMTVYAVWKSLYNEKLGQAVLKVSAKAKGYELVITPPAANLHTGFEIFRSEKKDFKPSKDNKIATVDRNILKYLDEKADNSKAYYYAVRAIDADGSYNGTKVTFIGKLSDKVLAAPLPKDKGVSAKVAGNGLVNLEFNKTIAAAKYKVVAEPSGTPSVPVTKEIAAKDVKQLANGKASINVDKLPLGKLLVFKLTALDDANEELVAYSNSTAFMLPVPRRQTARAKTIKIKKGKKKVKIRILDFKFSKVKWATGYEVKLSINGKKPKRIILKGKGGFMVIKGKRIVLPKRGKFKITFVAFRKIGNLKYYGTKITKSFR